MQTARGLVGWHVALALGPGTSAFVRAGAVMVRRARFMTAVIVLFGRAKGQ